MRKESAFVNWQYGLRIDPLGKLEINFSTVSVMIYKEK